MIDLRQEFADLKAHLEEDAAKAEERAASARTWLEQRLPEWAHVAEAAAVNPIVDAGLKIMHLSPEVLTGFAAALLEADRLLGEQKAAAQAAAEAAHPAESAA